MLAFSESFIKFASEMNVLERILIRPRSSLVRYRRLIYLSYNLKEHQIAKTCL